MIDPERFGTLRRQARLSHRAIADRSGLSTSVVRRVEEGHSSRVTLQRAGLLAAAIGCELRDLVCSQNEPSVVGDSCEGADNEEATADDARRLEAILFAAGKLMHNRAIGDALELPKERLERAAAQLEAAGEGRGITFYRSQEKWGLRPTVEVLSKRALQRLERGKVTTDGLSYSQAKVLYDILVDRRWGKNRLASLGKGGVQPHIASLINAGLVVVNHEKGLALGPEVVYALQPREAELTVREPGPPRTADAVAAAPRRRKG